MSRLSLFGRPFTVFDPADKDHRAYYYEFVNTGTWGRCPVRFVVPEDHGDLVTMIQRSLVKFYVERELNSVAKKQHKTLRQKRKKTVDN